jgi:hypothetical protein
MKVYPKVSVLAAWSENCKLYSSLPVVQLYRYFVSQSREFCRHNPLCCFSTNNTKGKHIFRYRLGPETFGYTLVYMLCTVIMYLQRNTRINIKLIGSVNFQRLYFRKFRKPLPLCWRMGTFSVKNMATDGW